MLLLLGCGSLKEHHAASILVQSEALKAGDVELERRSQLSVRDLRDSNITPWVISRDAVSDGNRVHGLNTAVVGITVHGNGLLVGAQVGLHDLVDGCAGRRASVGAHLLKERRHLGRRGPWRSGSKRRRHRRHGR